MKKLNVKRIKTVLMCILFTLFFAKIHPLQANNTDMQINVLNHIPSARALGMGNAYTALCSDVSSIYFNPAGLASLYQKEIYGTYENLRLNSTYWFAGIGFHKRNTGSFAFAVNYLGQDQRLDLNKNGYQNAPSQLLLLAGFGQHYKNENSINCFIYVLFRCVYELWIWI